MEKEEEDVVDPSALPIGKMKVGDDREDQAEEAEEGGRKSGAGGEGYNMGEVDYTKFEAFMSKKFGEQTFKMGYEIMAKMGNARFGEDKDKDIKGAMRKLFATEAELEDFIGLCSSYMILESYQSQMGKC